MLTIIIIAILSILLLTYLVMVALKRLYQVLCFLNRIDDRITECRDLIRIIIANDLRKILLHSEEKEDYETARKIVGIIDGMEKSIKSETKSNP